MTAWSKPTDNLSRLSSPPMRRLYDVDDDTGVFSFTLRIDPEGEYANAIVRSWPFGDGSRKPAPRNVSWKRTAPSDLNERGES